MEENDILKEPSPGKAFGIIIAEAAVAAVILLSVITVKYFFKDCYAGLREWYHVNICAETDVDEVIETVGGGADEV